MRSGSFSKPALLLGSVIGLLIAVNACSPATPTPTRAAPTPTPAPVATPTTAVSVSATATPTATRAAVPTVTSAPAPTPTKAATTPTANVDYTKLMGSIECPLCPAGLAQAHPLIAKYHWTKLPNPTGLKPKPGGSLTMDLTYVVTTWDPVVATGAYSDGSSVLGRLVIDDNSLGTAWKTNGENFLRIFVVCDLCESWKQTSPTEYVFNIRRDVTWHNVPPVNGRQFTAKDIEWTYNTLYMTPKAFQQAFVFANIESVTTTDDYTLVIKLKQPRAGFLEDLTGPHFPIHAKEAYEREGGLAVEPVIGTGAFYFKTQEKQARLVVTRNPKYYKKDAYGQQLPYVDQITRLWLPDVATRVAAWRSGQVDHMRLPGWDPNLDLLRTEQMGKTAFLRVMEHNAGGVSPFNPQLREPPFNDVRVRRAVSMALDRKELITLSLGDGYCGYTLPTWWMGYTYIPPCDEWGPWNKFNPDAAKALLKEAGFDASNPLTFKVWTVMTEPAKSYAETAVGQWARIGIKASVAPLASEGDSTALMRGKKWEGLAYYGHGPSTNLDGKAMVRYSQAPENYNGINDPEMDKLIEAQRIEFDVEKRRQLGRQIRERELDNVYYLWFGHWYFTEWTRPAIRDLASNQYGYASGWGTKSIEHVWLDK